MKRTPLLAVACLVALAMVLSAHAPADAKGAPGKKHRILLQWTEGDSIGQLVMTKHVGNLLEDLGDANVELEVLAYGFATPVVMAKNDKSYFQEDIRRFTARGVNFRVCHHAMDFFKITDAQLMPEVKTVKGAMSEIVARHEAGWQVLRP